MGRRTGITRGGGKDDGYVYDAIGQVTGAAFNAAPLGNETEAFGYDGVGNRTTSARNGSNTAYTANALDQYTAVGGQTQTHDANGNQVVLQVPGESALALGWDSENRLLAETRTAAPVGAPTVPLDPALTNGARIVNLYDPLHRRVAKEVHAPDGSGGWVLHSHTVFTYDGWNVIYEQTVAGSSTTTTRYTWGADLSGSRQGAGGVGGLLMAEEIVGSTATPHYYAYDGNGNVTHLTDASGTVEGTYRYTAFGGNLESTASSAFAQRNPWQFSTKYLDAEVETVEGFYYYGYRHYVAALGRWPSRDPIGEDGGLNLYEMVRNDVVSESDFLGLQNRGSACCGGKKYSPGPNSQCCGGKEVYKPKEKCCMGGTVKDKIPRWDRDNYNSDEECAALEAPDLADDSLGDQVQYLAENIIPLGDTLMDAKRLASCRELVCPKN